MSFGTINCISVIPSSHGEFVSSLLFVAFVYLEGRGLLCSTLYCTDPGHVLLGTLMHIEAVPPESVLFVSTVGTTLDMVSNVILCAARLEDFLYVSGTSRCVPKV